VWNYLEWGGAQVYFFGLMKKAAEVGEVSAFLPSGSHKQLLEFLKHLKVPCKFFNGHTDLKPASTLTRKIQRHWNKLFSEYILIKFLRKLNFENSVTHIELAPWQSFLAIRWLCQRSQVFITVHNSVLPIPKLRYLLWKIKFRLLSRHKNFHLFTANQDAKESLKTLVSKEYFDKITVTSANINPSEINEALNSEINRTELKSRYNLPSDKFLVFCVGQFIDRKGRWIFLEAARKLQEKNRDIAFVWISNSKPDEEDLQKAKKFELGENFIFITSDQIGKEHIDLFKLLRLADIFTLPSFLEGLPISLLEAMALGIPSVSTAVNGIPEAIKHLETGYLIKAGSADELASAVQELKGDKILRENLSKSGRRFVLENFNENTVAKIALERYLDALRKI
jgi:glycosyltransferase involved in cell wall biosynthesis